MLRDRLMTLDELSKIEPPRTLIAGMLHTRSLAWLIGAPGSYKSILAIAMASSVACGKAFEGRAVNAGPVLYVSGEGTAGLYQRVEAWSEGRVLPRGITWLPYAAQATTADWDQLIQIAVDIEAVLVVIDTQARATTNLDENEARDMGKFVMALDRLRDATGACVMPVHHLNRAGTNGRGHSVVDGAMDTIIKMNVHDVSGEVIEVSCVKQKDAAKFPPQWYEPREVRRSVVLDETFKRPVEERRSRSRT